MPKPELEFFRPDKIPWEPVTGSAQMGAGGPGVTQKILAKDEKGNVTRLLRFEAGVETKDTLTHDFWEEVWILEGELIDLAKRQTFTAGMYACRPPGMPHGPYRVGKPTMTLEIRYYGEQMGRSRVPIEDGESDWDGADGVHGARGGEGLTGDV